MLQIVPQSLVDPDIIGEAADRATRAIPPLWPLSSSVAVNPFLGQSGMSLAETGALLARVAGVPVTMPRAWYRERIRAGAITEQDLIEALSEAPPPLGTADLSAIKAAIARDAPGIDPLPTMAELAARASGIDWPGIVAERIGAWAAGYFDEGQALWAAPRGKSAFAAWRMITMHDLTPEILGLSQFALRVAEAADDAEAVIGRAVRTLGLSEAALDTYFHQILTTLGGWAQYARHRLWQAELSGGSDSAVLDLLAIRLLWEEALFEQYKAAMITMWCDVRAQHESPVAPTPDQVLDALLQAAAERAVQRSLANSLAQPAGVARVDRPALQAVFCIDVRSEVFRRALESLNPGIQTLGFAGFFGLGVSHRRFASDVAERRLPVLLNPASQSRAGGTEVHTADQSARYLARAKRAWGRFKLAAVSSFAFVEATGPFYAAKLLKDALGLESAKPPNDPAPRFDPAMDLTARVAAAAGVLRAMSLRSGLARLVLLAGHGANVVNNPHASALHCGACGGYSGEVNARLLAALLNDTEVRAQLGAVGIDMPPDTLFVAALHDTTTDAVTLYADDHPSPSHAEGLTQARKWLAAAGQLARTERALRLPGADSERAVRRRSRDWAEIRPEWALAGCRAFIAAPRVRTVGKNLQGRVFLHDYDWHHDAGFAVLELIMTAPVVVASWISLQYYGSAVAPTLFGAGDKLLHNVTGGIGVIEGNGGLLRAGLPWQSVHDGVAYAHDPLRLSVCVEAPCEAIAGVLAAHPDVLALFDNKWLHLFALDERGRMAWRYAGDLRWEAMGETCAAEERTRHAVPA